MTLNRISKLKPDNFNHLHNFLKNYRIFFYSLLENIKLWKIRSMYCLFKNIEFVMFYKTSVANWRKIISNDILEDLIIWHLYKLVWFIDTFSSWISATRNVSIKGYKPENWDQSNIVTSEALLFKSHLFHCWVNGDCKLHFSSLFPSGKY